MPYFSLASTSFESSLYLMLRLFIWSYLSFYIESLDFIKSTLTNSNTGYLPLLTGNNDLEYISWSSFLLSLAIWIASWIRLSTLIFFYLLKATDISSTEFSLHRFSSKFAMIEMAIQMKYSGEKGLLTKKSSTWRDSSLFKTSVRQTKTIGLRMAPKV